MIKSREHHNDQQDRRTIAQAQRARRADPGLRYRFERPIDEPALWLADTLAGATSASRARGADYLTLLDGLVVVCDMQL